MLVQSFLQGFRDESFALVRAAQSRLLRRQDNRTEMVDHGDRDRELMPMV